MQRLVNVRKELGAFGSWLREPTSSRVTPHWYAVVLFVFVTCASVWLAVCKFFWELPFHFYQHPRDSFWRIAYRSRRGFEESYTAHLRRRRFAHLLVAIAIGLSAQAVYIHQSSSPDVGAVLITPQNNKRPKDFAIIRKDATWHIFGIYCTAGNANCETVYPGLMHLTSTDLTSWTEVGYVIPPGSAGSWDAEQTWAPSIVERNGTYYMFYAGQSGPNGFGYKEQKIGLATSTDLYTWTKHPGNPVINCDDFSWAYWNASDSTGLQCRDPFVMWDDTEKQWVMFLTSRSTDSSPTTNPAAVGIAVSDDLTTWREFGHIPTTNDYTAESPHVFIRNGTYYLFITDNADGGQVLSYLTSSNLYTGWSSQANIPNVGSNEYATEYIFSGGREYLARISQSNTQYDIDEITWPSNVFTPQEISYATIGDYVWADSDADGIFDSGESGINSVSVKLYLDNGDDQFNLATDDLYASATTGDDPNTAGTQTGYYRFNKTIPGSYWLYIDPTNYASGGALANKVSTTNNTLVAVTMADNQSVLTYDVGFQTVDITWPLSTSANFTPGTGGSVTNGQASIALASAGASPTWWNTDWHDRKQITVTAGTENLTTNDTIILSENLTALVSAGKLQADFDDLRLVYWNGSANTEIDMDIIDATTQRFKLQAAISAGNNSGAYYLYYGHPSAPKRPTWLANVYEYYTSFNAKDGTTYSTWAESNSDTNWAISGNKWRYNAMTGADRFTRDTSKTIDLSQDWAIEAGLTVNSGEVGGLSFIRTETFDEDKYWLNFDAANDRTQFWQGSIGQLGSNDAVTLNTATGYVVRFEYLYNSSSSRTLRGFVNNALEHNVSQAGLLYDIWKHDGSYPNNLKSAHIGLSAYNGNVSFNDVKVWQLHDGSAVLGPEVNLHPNTATTVQPTSGGIAPFAKLESFSAATLPQGGSVNFVLSNDGGSSWLYWNGSVWAVSDSSLAQSNTLATINAQAGSFPMGNEQFLWRAVLSSTSNSAPVLLHVGVNVNRRSATPTLTGPADNASLSSRHPTLTFSTTDPESESLDYQIQIDTSSSFTSSQLQTMILSGSAFGWSNRDSDGGTRYNSGSTASYTVTNPLSGGTWYWRVRSIEAGSNIYSNYSATRSFSLPSAVSLSSIQARASTSTSISVSWTSSIASTGVAQYGTTAAYGSEVSSSVTGLNHEVTINGLQPNTQYYLRTISTADGQSVTSPGFTVTTSGTSIQGLTVTAIGTTSAKISWTTSESTVSDIRYGTTHAYTGNRQSVTAQRNGAGTQHSVTLKNLKAGTQYHYYISSVGTSTVQSGDQHFTTLGYAAAPKLNAPVVRHASKQLIITGQARGRQTITFYIAGRWVGEAKTRGVSERTYTFTKTVSLKQVSHGLQTITAQSVDSQGRTSRRVKSLTFRY